MDFWKWAVKHSAAALTGFAAALFVGIFVAAGLLTPIEDRAYDLFLRLRPRRERPD